MAAFDYARLAALADEKVERFGRDVTLVKASRTPSSASEPWRGPGTTAATLAAKAVFGESREIARPDTTSDQRMRAVQVLVRMAEVGLEDLATYRHLNDAGKLRRIVTAEPIQPGPLNVLWILELEA